MDFKTTFKTWEFYLLILSIPVRSPPPNLVFPVLWKDGFFRVSLLLTFTSTPKKALQPSSHSASHPSSIAQLTSTEKKNTKKKGIQTPRCLL